MGSRCSGVQINPHGTFLAKQASPRALMLMQTHACLLHWIKNMLLIRYTLFSNGMSWSLLTGERSDSWDLSVNLVSITLSRKHSVGYNPQLVIVTGKPSEGK